jgi:glucokinase
MKKRIKLRATRLAIKIAELLADFASTAMALVSTKVERMYQMRVEKAQKRLAPRPNRSCSSFFGDG